MIVFGRTSEEHIVRLHQVLSRLRDANLKLSSSKCKHFLPQVEYLGHIVSAEGVATDPKKVEAIAAWPTPRSAKDVRSFVGLCSYYGRFVCGFADIAHPLHKATEADTPFRWTEECETAFQTLKRALTSPPILAYPDDSGDFILDTDASGFGIGAVLSQIQSGSERVIGYYSRVLTKPEQQYCVTRRELLAVVCAVKHFHHYVYGHHFLVRTDHGSLRWLLGFKNPEGHMWRWLQVLGIYDFEIQHRPGSQHRNADGLSRRPCTECRHCELQERKEETGDHGCPGHRVCALNFYPVDTAGQWREPWNKEEIQGWQKDDSILATVITWFGAGQKPPKKGLQAEGASLRTYWSCFEQLELVDGLVYRKADPTNRLSAPRLVAPRAMQDQIFAFLHSKRTGGHLGIKRTLSSIRQRFWWPGMKQDVTRWCTHCDVCQRRKPRPGAQRSSLHQEPVGIPMERLAFDILSFQEETAQGNTCVLVICDYFTKWVEAFPLVDHRAQTVADVLVTEVFLRFGIPRFLHSDQAPEFMSELINELCELLEIQRTRTCPYRPQSDGLVERINRTLIDMLSKFCNERYDDWDRHLPYLLCAYRATVNESTGCSPNLLMLGRESTLPVDLMYPPKQYQGFQCHNEYVEWLRRVLQDSYESARHQLGVAASRQKRYYDARTKDHRFREGDFVLRFYPPNRRNKLKPRFIGPFRVMAPLGDVTYSIQKSSNSKPVTVHVDHLKLYHTEQPIAIWSTQVPAMGEQDPEVEPRNDDGAEVDGNFSEDETENRENIDASTVRRSNRKCRTPVHFSDYYMQ